MAATFGSSIKCATGPFRAENICPEITIETNHARRGSARLGSMDASHGRVRITELSTMVNADELHFTVAQSAPNDPGENAYIVTVNDAGQHAIWPAARPRPAGWRARTVALSLTACRRAVTTLWPDITPPSVAPDTAVSSEDAVESALVPSLFAARAAGHPGALAVRGAAQLTYGALLRSANRLARALQEIG